METNLSCSTFTLLICTRTDIEHIQHRVNSVTENFLRKDIESWLSPVDPSTNLNEALRLRHKQTGDWLLTHQYFITWEKSSAAFLWLTGIPGCGKTVLSANVIEHLQQTSTGPRTPLAYFYYDFKDVTKQSFSAMLRSLVYQLCSASQDMWVILYSLYRSRSSGRSQPSDEAIKEIFNKALDYYSRATIVIDTLDECQHRINTLRWLKQIRTRPCLKVIITSRGEEDIRAELTFLSSREVLLIREDDVNLDIHTCINARLYGSSEFSMWRDHPEVLHAIETELLEKSRGM